MTKQNKLCIAIRKSSGKQWNSNMQKYIAYGATENFKKCKQPCSCFVKTNRFLTFSLHELFDS